MKFALYATPVTFVMLLMSVATASSVYQLYNPHVTDYALDFHLCDDRLPHQYIHGDCVFNDCWKKLARNRTGALGEETLYVPDDNGSPCLRGEGLCFGGSCVAPRKYGVLSAMEEHPYSGPSVSRILEEEVSSDLPYCGQWNTALGYDRVFCTTLPYMPWSTAKPVCLRAQEACRLWARDDDDDDDFIIYRGNRYDCLCSMVDNSPCEGLPPARAVSFDLAARRAEKRHMQCPLSS